MQHGARSTGSRQRTQPAISKAAPQPEKTGLAAFDLTKIQSFERPCDHRWH